MRRVSARLRIDDDGRLEIIDPGLDMLPLLDAVQPGFKLRQQAIAELSSPRLMRARHAGTGLEFRRLAGESEALMWGIHAEFVECLRTSETLAPCGRDEASLLDLKREIARRVLAHCQLCAHRCRVDRTKGELGVCRLGTAATVAEHFIHIAEEAPINPSIVLNLAGCGMRCRYCQQSALLDPSAVSGDLLDAALWNSLDTSRARSLSFVGGNPDESLFAILGFLAATPAGWDRPVVWNCHAYSTPETLTLLDGIVDAYVPDLKYGNDECGRRWSAAPGYAATARDSVAAMVAQDAVVIVRVLVLPGHFECCHAPVLDFLAPLARSRLFVSVRGQYFPDWRITAKDGAMARRPTAAEVEAVRLYAQGRGLQVVDGRND